jgi:hypothetical protein
MAKRPEPIRAYQVPLAFDEPADQIIPRYRRSRRRAPTPCINCGSRELKMLRMTEEQMFSAASNAHPFPTILCGACGRERADIHRAPDPTKPPD